LSGVSISPRTGRYRRLDSTDRRHNSKIHITSYEIMRYLNIWRRTYTQKTHIKSKENLTRLEKGLALFPVICLSMTRRYLWLNLELRYCRRIKMPIYIKFYAMQLHFSSPNRKCLL
jgi:hypothetical protein